MMQQLGNAKVHILIKHSYKFNFFTAKKLICEFYEKGGKGKSSNKLLKKFGDSSSITKRTESGQRCSVHSDASLVFTRYSTII